MQKDNEPRSPSLASRMGVQKVRKHHVVRLQPGDTVTIQAPYLCAKQRVQGTHTDIVPSVTRPLARPPEETRSTHLPDLLPQHLPIAITSLRATRVPVA